MHCALLALKFQFHKVRLKVGTKQRGKYSTEFQFHKVRLKGAAYLLPIFLTQVSIP